MPLRAAIEQRERQAARLIVEIAAELNKPTGTRAPVAEALTALRDHYMAVADMAARLRAEIGGTGARFLRQSRIAGTDERFLRLMRARLSLWDKVLDACDHIDAGREWPLLPPPRDRFDLGAPEERIMSRVFTRAHLAVNRRPQAAESSDLGAFPDIPLNVGHFLVNAHLAYRVLLARKQERPFRFIDVGCGGGVKVILAADIFDRADGLEYDAGYVETARETLRATKAARSEIVHADGINFDGYGNYDVIYFYQPMSKEHGLLAMEEQIASTAAPGTILIAPYEGFIPRAEALGCMRLCDRVYITGLDEEGAEALRAEVIRMGPHIVDPNDRLPANVGWMRPLWQACQANGINPG